MLGVGNNRVGDHKTFVVESSDGFELSEDNKFVETNGTHETNTKPSNKDSTVCLCSMAFCSSNGLDSWKRQKLCRRPLMSGGTESWETMTIRFKLGFQQGGNVGHQQFP